MKALLLKDYYTLGKSLRSLALIVLLWSVIPMAFLNVFAMIYGSMIPYSAMAYDQQSRWNTFARMLPYREKDIVLSRYVLGWLCTAVGGAAVLVFQNVLSLFSPPLRLFSLDSAGCFVCGTSPAGHQRSPDAPLRHGKGPVGIQAGHHSGLRINRCTGRIGQ